MKKFARLTALAAALIGALVTAPSALATGSSLRVFGLTDDNRLVRFRSDTPGYTNNRGYISGLITDTKLVGIDFRIQNGLLYGVGNLGGIYTINTSNAYATLIDRLDIPLDGTSFGVDFNPAANALRVISDTGQNLRHPFMTATGEPGPTVMDGGLSYPVTPPAVPTPASGVTGAAYTNNDLDAINTATTLFDIDTTLDQVVIQSPANSGTIVATGKLGVDAGIQAGFDTFSRRNSAGTTAENRAFATLFVSDAYRFYRIDLLTGKANQVGKFAKDVVDIAIDLNQ